MAGETGPILVTRPVAMVIAGFFAVAMYNTVEILVAIFATFRRRKGLYFWSLLVASIGIPVHSVAALLRFFALAPNLAMVVIIILGWWAMVTGQSVVLYSRLHLVMSDSKKLRWAKMMIIANFLVLHIPVAILFLGSNSVDPDSYINAFNTYEKIQLAGFTVQESILSGLYLWEASRGLKYIMNVKPARGESIIRHLFLLFVVVVLLDVSLMVTEYTDNFQIQTTYKPVVYSVKLKIEFVILNELVSFTRGRRSSCTCLGDTFSSYTRPDSRSLRRASTNLTLVSNGEHCSPGIPMQNARRYHQFEVLDAHLPERPIPSPGREELKGRRPGV